MKKIFFLLLLILTGAAYAQNHKINFRPVALQEALKLSAQEHKVIFMDCFTDWCIPCKQMEATVFKVDSVADFFNKSFINVQANMEKPEYKELTKAYKIGAFPSYLLLDEKGNILYKFVGYMPAKEFMANIRKGLSPDNTVAVMNKRYESGDKDHAFLREYILLKLRLMEISTAVALNDKLMNLLTPEEKAKKDNWVLFGDNRYTMYLSRARSRNFAFLADNWASFVPELSKDTVDHKMSTIFRETAGYALRGYMFKDHPYDRAEFERYKTQISATTMPDKDQLMVLMNMAEAAGEKKPELASNYLADNVLNFSQTNQEILWDYIAMCDEYKYNGYKYPRMKEIAEKVIKTNKNHFLVDFLKQNYLYISTAKNAK